MRNALFLQQQHQQPTGTPVIPSGLGLSRLRTAFGTPQNSRPTSTCSIGDYDSVISFSPAPSDASIFSSTSSSYSNTSRISLAVQRLRQMIMLRHRPSTLELGLEEEKREYGRTGALDVLEPRPMSLGKMGVGMGFGSAKMGSPVVVGIFEVLEGAA